MTNFNTAIGEIVEEAFRLPHIVFRGSLAFGTGDPSPTGGSRKYRKAQGNLRPSWVDSRFSVAFSLGKWYDKKKFRFSPDERILYGKLFSDEFDQGGN